MNQGGRVGQVINKKWPLGMYDVKMYVIITHAVSKETLLSNAC